MSRQTWTIDPDHTLVEFSARHMMIAKVKGRFADVEGTVEIDPDVPQNSTVEVEIDAASIDTRQEDRDAHLRSGDFLDVESHPTIRFESTRVEGDPTSAGDEFTVVGDLTIRGETREVTLDATFEGHGSDPWGNERAGFSASTSIDRREFGLTWNQALETGGVLVGHEISISLEVELVAAEAGVSA